VRQAKSRIRVLGWRVSLPHISFEPAGQMTLKHISAPVEVIRILQPG